MADRPQLIRDAFAAFATGDLAPFERLFAPDATWVGVPGGGENGEPAVCADRATTVGRLRRHYEHGRRFTAGKVVESCDRVAVAVTIVNPEWSGPVSVFKVFTFRPGDDVVVRLNDCIDESYALQVLAA